MLNQRNYKETISNFQEIKLNFTGYIENIEYKSDEYYDLINKKIIYSIEGFQSHPIYFDIMRKNGINYYIGNRKID